MKKTKALTIAVLLIGACSEAPAPVDQNGAGPVGTAVPVAAAVSNSAAAVTEAPAPAPVAQTLSGDGLAPALKFGMAQAEAVAAATKLFGKPTDKSHNGDCGEGAMDFVGFGDFQLGFQEGKLAGWTLNGKSPALRTAQGITIGTPRKALGRIPIEQSTLGPEFSVNDDAEYVGGILGKDDKVEALWAGMPCQFR